MGKRETARYERIGGERDRERERERERLRGMRELGKREREIERERDRERERLRDMRELGKRETARYERIGEERDCEI